MNFLFKRNLEETRTKVIKPQINEPRKREKTNERKTRGKTKKEQQQKQEKAKRQKQEHLTICILCIEITALFTAGFNLHERDERKSTVFGLFFFPLSVSHWRI